MKRSIAIADRQTYTDSRQLWLVVLFGAALVALLWATAASGATAYYTVTGSFADGSETQSFLFNTDEAISSTETLSLRTWHYVGGINAAGDVIPGGGFDPILRLYSGETLVAVDDDIDRSIFDYDAELTWRSADYSPPEIALRAPFRSGDYRLDLNALSGGGSPWAVDLVGPSDRLTLIGFAESDGTGNSEISTLKAGNGAQVAFDGSYVLNGGKSFTFQSGADFTVGGFLDIGNTTGGSLNVMNPGTTLTTNTASTTYLDWGLGGGVASVALSDQATANILASYINIAADASSIGLLTVESGADMTTNGIYLASAGGLGQVEVRGAGSTLTQNSGSTLTIGSVSGLAGLLYVHDDAVFTSGAGAIEVNPTGQIRVNDATFNANGNLTVASTGAGLGGVILENQGQINSRDVTVAISTADGSVRINGYTPTVGPPATWNATGTMRIGSGLFGRGFVTVEQLGRLHVSDDIMIGAPDPAGAGKLTVQTNGKVTVDDTLSAGDYGTVELLGGEIATRSFTLSSGGTLVHTDGTLTVDGGEFTIEPGELVISSATGTPIVRLQNGANGTVPSTYYYGLGILTIGGDYNGRLEILSEATLTSGAGVIGGGSQSSFGLGHVLVQGNDSLWHITGVAGAGGVFAVPFRIGGRSLATLEILDGGQVQVDGLADIAGSVDWGGSFVTVDGTGSKLRATANLSGSTGRLTIGRWDTLAQDNCFLTVSNGGRVEVEDDTNVYATGLVKLTTAGEIQTGSFIVHPGGTLTHEDGTLTVDGGTFDPGVSDYIFDGAAAADLPIVRLDNGASASLHRGTSVAYNHRARLEILNGSHVTLQDVPGNVIVGFGEGSEGEIVVDGHSSELIAPGGIAVGNDGRGTLRIRNGGSLYVQNSTRDLIAASTRSEGLVEVTGTDLGGAPSTYTTSGELHVGSRGPGILAVSGGGHVNVLADAEIAWCAGSDGSSATVTDPGSNWTITGSLYVGGQSSMAGGSGQLTVANSGQVVAANNIKIWQPGTIELNNGVLSALSMEVAGGTLRGWGSVVLPGVGTLHNAGVVSPDFAIRTIAISGNYVQDPAGTLAIEIGGASQFEYGRLETVVGTTSLAGTLAVSLIDLAGEPHVFMPAAGDSFDILDWSSRIGTFDTLLLPPLTPGLMWNAAQLYTAGILKVVVAGDYNSNGIVDAADYTVWRDTLGSTTDLRANGDDTGASAGVIDGADYLAWKTHFGLMAGSGSLALRSPPLDSISGIPEPTALSPVCLAVVWLLFWRESGGTSVACRE